MLVACGGDSGPSGPGGGGGGGGNLLQARIDGALWTATPALIQASSNTSQLVGSLLFMGSTQTAPARTLSIHLGRISVPGTYPLGVNTGTHAGGTLTMSVGSESWWTPLNGNAGQITISSIANGRVRGTFRARLQRLGGSGNTTAIEVTDGEFDVPINPGYAVPPVDDRGSTATGTVGGQQWYAATVVGGGGGSSTVAISASNDDYLIAIALAPPETGTAPLSQAQLPVRTVTVVKAPGGEGWGTMPGASGTVTLSSVTATRVQGTLDVTLPATGGGTPITLNLTFDVRTVP